MPVAIPRMCFAIQRYDIGLPKKPDVLASEDLQSLEDCSRTPIFIGFREVFGKTVNRLSGFLRIWRQIRRLFVLDLPRSGDAIDVFLAEIVAGRNADDVDGVDRSAGDIAIDLKRHEFRDQVHVVFRKSLAAHSEKTIQAAFAGAVVTVRNRTVDDAGLHIARELVDDARNPPVMDEVGVPFLLRRRRFAELRQLLPFRQGSIDIWHTTQPSSEIGGIGLKITRSASSPIARSALSPIALFRGLILKQRGKS